MSMTRLITRQMMSATGTVTANGSTAVPVTSPVPIGANSQILLTLKTVGGTPSSPYLSAITTGIVGTAAFSIKSAVGDTSVYNYTIIG